MLLTPDRLKFSKVFFLMPVTRLAGVAPNRGRYVAPFVTHKITRSLTPCFPFPYMRATTPKNGLFAFGYGNHKSARCSAQQGPVRNS